MPPEIPGNLYVHFPFCRRKCAYCALHSRAGSTAAARAEYVAGLAGRIAECCRRGARFKTVYFGGGSPALCDLRPLFGALAPALAQDAEFTVELHPLDVAPALLDTLKAGGVNRISMGVQSLDDAVLQAMGRMHTRDEARRAFDAVRARFDNAGIDLIAGFPAPPGAEGNADAPGLDSLRDWGLSHCSVYSLILERNTRLDLLVRRGECEVPGDDETMDAIAGAARAMERLGLERYEISNYALPGRECRHNLAVWRGEDYLGLGDGAYGRIGLERTHVSASGDGTATTETLSPEQDRLERTLFRLRTREGIDAAQYPAWRETLDGFAAQGLLSGSFPLYRLTERGTEVCDTILAELV